MQQPDDPRRRGSLLDRFGCRRERPLASDVVGKPSALSKDMEIT